MSTFTRTNLEKGLTTFVKLPAMQKRHDAAVSLYEGKVADGMAHDKAIELALAAAVKGLKDNKAKLQTARKAAGLTLGARLQSSKPTPKAKASSKAKPKPVVAQSAQEVSASPWVTAGLLTIVGIAFGLIFAPMADSWYDQHDAVQFGGFAYWAILLLTTAFFGAIGFMVGIAFNKRQLRRGTTTTTVTTTTQTA